MPQLTVGDFFFVLLSYEILLIDCLFQKAMEKEHYTFMMKSWLLHNPVYYILFSKMSMNMRCQINSLNELFLRRFFLWLLLNNIKR